MHQRVIFLQNLAYHRCALKVLYVAAFLQKSNTYHIHSFETEILINVLEILIYSGYIYTEMKQRLFYSVWEAADMQMNYLFSGINYEHILMALNIYDRETKLQHSTYKPDHIFSISFIRGEVWNRQKLNLLWFRYKLYQFIM